MSNKQHVRRPRPHASRPGWEVLQVFFGAGAVYLTDRLVDELAARGWSREDLERFRSYGAMYSRPRDSIVFPPGVFPPEFSSSTAE